MQLCGGTSYITYPIYTNYNPDGTIQIDPNDQRVASIKVGERIELTKLNITEIVYSETDYVLEYALNLMNE